MSNLYFSSLLLMNASLDRMFSFGSALGFDGIEVWSQHFHLLGFSAGECKALSDQWGMEIVVHAPSWDVNIASLSEEIRRASLEEVKRSMDFAVLAGAGEVTVHPGHISAPVRSELHLARLHESLEELHGYSREKDMPLSMEVMEKTPSMMGTSSESMRLAMGDLFGSFRYTVDVAHCDDEEEVYTLLSTLPRVSKLHLSNRQGWKFHTPLFQGDHDFLRMLPGLRATGLPLVLEGKDRDGDFGLLRSTVDFMGGVPVRKRSSKECTL